MQADIEILRRLGCHPATVVTALTAQDTVDVQAVYPQAAADFQAQARLLMADLPIKAIKIGLLGSVQIAEAVADCIDAAGGVPVVLDPILAAGGGHALAGERVMQAVIRLLLPRATVVTPNTVEASRLTGRSSPDDCAAALQAMGCPHVVLTGTHEEGADVVNRWYGPNAMEATSWPRLPESYHGSGCTLAAAVAGGLALGWPLVEAVAVAQRLTWESLRDGYAVGRGQRLPRRTG